MKKNTGLENIAVIETSKMLGLQKYPCELDKYLDLINAEAKIYGWPIVVIKAYCFGVINGKRFERNKRNTRFNKTTGGKAGGNGAIKC